MTVCWKKAHSNQPYTPHPTPIQMSQLLCLSIPPRPSWSSKTDSYRDVVVHSGSLMTLQSSLRVLLSFVGQKQHLAAQLCGMAASSWEGESRNSNPLWKAGDWGYSYLPPVTRITFCLDMIRCPQFPRPEYT